MNSKSNIIKEKIIESLEELGIFVDESDEDIDLNEYGLDSFMYISLIVTLEDKLGISFPDELLLREKFSSINGFANLLSAFIK